MDKYIYRNNAYFISIDWGSFRFEMEDIKMSYTNPIRWYEVIFIIILASFCFPLALIYWLWRLFHNNEYNGGKRNGKH